MLEEQSGDIPGFDGVPDMNPLGCQKGAAWQIQMEEGDRILRPLRRVGERGSGSWEEVSWDEALVTVADAVIDALDAAGSDAVVFDQGVEAGVLASMARTRLGRALDCVNLDVNASVSDVHLGHWATFGNLVGGSTADDTFRSDVVIVWNGNPAFTRIPYFHYLPEARYRGAKIVLVAPDYSPSAIHADMFVPVRPGTDAALALSMCQVILEEGRADLNFVRSQTYLPLLVVCATGRFLTGADMEAGGMPHRFYGWGEGAAEQVDPARFRLPAGDARPEWDVFAALACAISDRAVARGLEVFRDSQGANRSFADVGGSFMAGGRLADGESVLDELLRDSALSGNLPADTSLATIRERGWVRPVRLPRPMSSMCGADISASEPMVAYRTHVEEGVPFETLTGRAQFYVDHPWFLEADEQLPRHKEAPAMGGDHPFCVTGGHPRWSIHATNTTNRVILETTRGHPVVHLNPGDALARGIGDDDPVEVYNDLGSLTVAAKVSASVRPGQLILYASWEQYLYRDWKDATWVEPGMVKWLHFVGGYGHLGYSPRQWQPIQSDRVYRVDVRSVSPGSGSIEDAKNR